MNPGPRPKFWPKASEPCRCVHFRGIQNVCGAGIDPMTLRDTSGPGMAKWPCLQLAGRETCATTCQSFRAMTREEIDAETAKMIAASDAFENRLAGGLCGQCGAKMESKRKQGRCVYAVPCGHRLGQHGDEATP